MSLERKRRALQLLEDALGHPADQRDAFLDQACGDDAAMRREVAAMLAAEQEAGPLSAPAFDVHGADPLIGQQIGHYRLLEQLGRGGMGAVYLAERLDDYRQRVALKVIRRGLDLDTLLVQRFHNERQILARLEHPAIARLLDGGTIGDQVPYFVMEYVEGEPIDAYCRRHALSLRSRLELFRKVCAAVQFAHANLVIHRDLKPGNILITEDGEPKLLDFGIAKLLDEGQVQAPLVTATGQSPMTPRYASPEQVRMEPITTASDVYTLGVLLYEVLTGASPYRLETERSDEASRAVCDQEPERPSTAVGRQDGAQGARARRQLRGDLDSIVLKALRKEPAARYGSAERLGDDIGRYLDGQPVLARPGTWRYRAGKFVRRHRLALAAVTAFVGLVVGFGVYSNLLRQKAEREQYRADRTLEFFKKTFENASPAAGAGPDVTVQEILLLAKEELLDNPQDDPFLSTEFAGTLGELFRALGLYVDAREMMEASLTAAFSAYHPPHAEIAKRLNNLAVLHYDFEDFAAAEERFRQALAMWRALDASDPTIFRTRSGLATTSMMRGELDEALRQHAEILAEREAFNESRADPHDPDVATSRHNVAAAHLALGRFVEAAAYAEEALESRQEAEDPQPTHIANTFDLLGQIHLAAGQLTNAEPALEKALDLRERHLLPGHKALATTRRNLAELELLLDRDLDLAEHLLGQALQVFRRHNPESWRVADAISVEGSLRLRRGDLEAAGPLLRDGYRRLAAICGERATVSQRAKARLLDYLEQAGLDDELARYQGAASSVSP